MAGLNSVELIGNLGADPEIRFTQSGKQVANFNMATNERWTERESGDKKEKTEWHRIVAWQGLAGVVESYCKKGSLIYIEGRLQTRDWTDKDGTTRYTTEIVARNLQLLGANGGTGRATNQPGDPGAQDENASSKEPTSIPDDDIPF